MISACGNDSIHHDRCHAGDGNLRDVALDAVPDPHAHVEASGMNGGIKLWRRMAVGIMAAGCVCFGQLVSVVPVYTDHLLNVEQMGDNSVHILGVWGGGNAYAADVGKKASSGKDVGTCVLRNCQKALAQCLGDAPCLENLVCLQACNGAEDETACQIRCGDRYQDKAVDLFNTCAVSDKKCVPQRVDEGVYPVPPTCALDASFDLTAFQGRWYITAGLNKLFDTFPCQEHYFASPEGSPNVVFGEINWRIPLGPKPEEGFIQRSTMQRFVQDTNNPAILYNHDNEYLHYQDDWYILASKPDEYVFIYYKGENDAWKGYGGATVYTRESKLPEKYIPELREAAENAGLKWEDFTLTDNSCPPKPVRKGPLEELELDIAQAERFANQEVTSIEKILEPQLRSFGKGFTVFEDEAASSLQKVEKEIGDEAAEAAHLIKRFQMEAKMGGWVKWIPLPVREIIMPVR